MNGHLDPLGRIGRLDAEALATDHYLESLLASAVRREPDAEPPAEVDPALEAVAIALRDGAVRVHPSFRFEERLARRLAEAAADLRLVPAASGETGAPVIAFRRAGGAAAGVAAAGVAAPGVAAADVAAAGVAAAGIAAEDVAEGAARAAQGSPRPIARPLIVGGALTSAAISIAGAAFVAWRLARSGAAGAGAPGSAAGSLPGLLRRLD